MRRFLVVEVEPGDSIAARQVIARITDTFSDADREVVAPFAEIVVGLTTNPVVNRGDAVVHVAQVSGPAPAW